MQEAYQNAQNKIEYIRRKTQANVGQPSAGGCSYVEERIGRGLSVPYHHHLPVPTCSTRVETVSLSGRTNYIYKIKRVDA